MIMSTDRLEANLQNWASWMQAGGLYIGFPPKSAGFTPGGTSTDFESMLEIADAVAARMVDCLIDGLPNIEQIAIANKYLQTVFRGRHLEDALERAKVRLREGLMKRGMY
jgi:hypothetical protein